MEGRYVKKIIISLSTMLAIGLVAFMATSFLTVSATADSASSNSEGGGSSSQESLAAATDAAQAAAEATNDAFVNSINNAAKKAVNDAAAVAAYAAATNTLPQYTTDAKDLAAGALAGAPTAVVDTKVFSCFNQKMLDAVKKNNAINYEIHYTFNGKKSVLVIPAGADYTKVVPSNFYGFKYLAAVFGGYDE